jgi:predicted TIM-barrel fold metal-dependent hydrolase
MTMTRREMLQALGLLAVATTVSHKTALSATMPHGPGGSLIKSDAHCHVVDFIQGSEGLKSLIDHMDQAGVAHCQIMGLPVTKKWDRIDRTPPTYYLDNDSRVYFYGSTDVDVARAYQALPASKRSRLHPFLCGFNPTDQYAINHVRRMFDWFPDVWQGIGEIMLRHDDLTALTLGETATADHPALDPVYAFAARRNLPVQLHSNVGNKRLKEPVYLYEVENALAKHPATTIILAHAGVSRSFNIPTIAADIKGLMARHPNLWIDLSWVVYEECVAPGGHVDERWVDLVEAFPWRVMIGTDMIGHWSDYATTIGKYDPFLAKLRPETAVGVASRNFLALVGAGKRTPAVTEPGTEEAPRQQRLSLLSSDVVEA